MDKSNVFNKESILLKAIERYLSNGAKRSDYVDELYPQFVRFNNIASMALKPDHAPLACRHWTKEETILRLAKDKIRNSRSYPDTITSELVDDFGIDVAGCAGQLLLIARMYKDSLQFRDRRASDAEYYMVYLCSHIKVLMDSVRNKHPVSSLLSPPATKEQFMEKDFTDWRWREPMLF